MSSVSPFRDTTCVVTGANGFVGSHLVQRLAQQGARVHALVRKTSDLTLLADTTYKPVYGDVTDRTSLEAAFDTADYIFHVAGVVKALEDETYDHINRGGTENVCLAAQSAAPKLKRLVHVSSLAAAGPTTPGHPRSESEPDAPVSLYGRSKLAGEISARRYFDVVPSAIARPPWVFGPGDSSNLELFTALKRHLKVVVTGGPRVYSFIYATDLADGLMATASHEAALNQTFFITSAETMDYQVFQEHVLDELGTWAVRIPVPAMFLPWIGASADWVARRRGKAALLSRQKVDEALPKAWLCSPDKARDRLGFRANTRIVDGIKVQTRWYRDHGWI